MTFSRKGEEKRGEKGCAVNLHKMTNGSSSTAVDEQLFPGLLDHIVMRHIVPKLPWRAFHILSLVSRRWREANQSRRIYDTRVRSHSTETLLVLNHTDRGWASEIMKAQPRPWIRWTNQDTLERPPGSIEEHDVISSYWERPHPVRKNDNVISLYSLRDDSWHLLPQFPKSRQYQRGIPTDCQCISLDGKIYVLGGLKKNGYYLEEASEVYVLDLAGQRKWEKCANMPQPRYAFGCGVVDEKIYVFGGLSRHEPTCESVVYDPTANVWSSISVSNQTLCDPRVFRVGKELFVHTGQPTMEVYHTDKDEWRTLELWRKMERKLFTKSEVLFTAKGKLHRATPFGIYRHDNDGDGNISWARLHSFSGFEERETDTPSDLDELNDSEYAESIRVIAGDDELLALVKKSFSYKDHKDYTCLYRSIGFGIEKEGLVWDPIDSKILKDHQCPHFICPIQL